MIFKWIAASMLTLSIALFAFGWRPALANNGDTYLGEDLNIANGPEGGLVVRHPSDRRLNFGVAWNSDEVLLGAPMLHFSWSQAFGLERSRVTKIPNKHWSI